MLIWEQGWPGSVSWKWLFVWEWPRGKMAWFFWRWGTSDSRLWRIGPLNLHRIQTPDSATIDSEHRRCIRRDLLAADNAENT